MAKKFSRRNLFRLRLGDITELARETIGTSEEETDSEAPPGCIRPPGALADDMAFLKVCDRCKLCSEACPHGVIRHMGVADGPLEGSPFLQPETNPCRWCADMPCIHACPSGALAFQEDGSVSPIAKAKLNRSSCLTESGILCDTCSYRCPQNIRAITMSGRSPKLNVDQCVGCGLCAYYCDSKPSSFTIYLADTL